MRKFLVIALCFAGMMTLAPQTNAKFRLWKRHKTETKQEKKVSDYDKFLKDKPETHKGFITLHKVKQKLYFEVPMNMMGRDMLLGSTISEISDNGNGIVGSKPKSPVLVTFEKVGKRVNLVSVNKDLITDSTNPKMQESIDRNSAGAILQSFDIKAYNNDSTSVVFEVTDFFVSDEKLMPAFDPYSAYTSGRMKRSESFQSDKSFLSEVKAFDNNVSIKSYLSYTYTLTRNSSTIRSDVPFTVLMTRSILLLDEKPYTPRPIDSRIGIFPTQKLMFSEKEQKSKNIYFANRWRVEPSDTAAYRSGKAVKVKKPIVFYIDPGFPSDWKYAIYEAVNQWKEPFERIGLLDAIEARPYPSDDPEFDPDNLKYNCIVYAPIGIENAMGPSWVDPRSGEIVNASVYVYHDVVNIVNSWRFIQTSPADKNVRSGHLPQKELYDGLRYVITHEVGHTLGLMHNMRASYTVPVDSLRSPSFTQKYGTTHSIMDYARFNYVAQPGDKERGVKLTPPKFGLYDYYAIKVVYTPLFDSKNIEDEYKTVDKWISEAQKDTILQYGRQQFRTILDPRSQTEDLGNDAIKASEYGIRNLKYVLGNLNSWVKNDPDFSYRKNAYTGIIYQYFTYIQHVYSNIGGFYINDKLDGDPVEGIRSIPKQKQLDALHFLFRQINDLDWLDNEEVSRNLQLFGSPKKVMEAAIAQAIVSAPFMLSRPSAVDPVQYDFSAFLDEVYDFVWKPSLSGKALSEQEMMLQREFVNIVCMGAGLKYAGASSSSKKLWNGNIEMPEMLREYSLRNHIFCNGESHSIESTDRSEISGYEEPSYHFIGTSLPEAELYSYVLKIRDLVKAKARVSSGETKTHYELLSRNLEKTLK